MVLVFSFEEGTSDAIGELEPDGLQSISEPILVVDFSEPDVFAIWEMRQFVERWEFFFAFDIVATEYTQLDSFRFGGTWTWTLGWTSHLVSNH